MTLLLAARAKDHVAVLADGLSFTANGDQISVQREDLPKLFTVEGLPVVIAHHGQNKLGSIDVHQFMTSHQLQRTIQREWQRGLNHVLGRVILELDTTVTQTLESSEWRRDFGLWFVGMWPCTDMPEIVELIWQNNSPGRTRVRTHPLGDLSFGGAGSKYLREELSDFGKDALDQLVDGKPETTMKSLKELYRESLQRQDAASETLFGGQALMAFITQDGVDLGPVEITAGELSE